MDVQQREHWSGPARLGTAWTMTKGQQLAVCELCSHQFGWELRLTIGRELVRSQVCRATDDVLRSQEEWRAALGERGYCAGHSV
jgi:hypothetical protein